MPQDYGQYSNREANNEIWSQGERASGQRPISPERTELEHSVNNASREVLKQENLQQTPVIPNLDELNASPINFPNKESSLETVQAIDDTTRLAQLMEKREQIRRLKAEKSNDLGQDLETATGAVKEKEIATSEKEVATHEKEEGTIEKEEGTHEKEAAIDEKVIQTSSIELHKDFLRDHGFEKMYRSKNNEPGAHIKIEKPKTKEEARQILKELARGEIKIITEEGHIFGAKDAAGKHKLGDKIKLYDSDGKSIRDVKVSVVHALSEEEMSAVETHFEGFIVNYFNPNANLQKNTQNKEEEKTLQNPQNNVRPIDSHSKEGSKPEKQEEKKTEQVASRNNTQNANQTKAKEQIFKSQESREKADEIHLRKEIKIIEDTLHGEIKKLEDRTNDFKKENLHRETIEEIKNKIDQLVEKTGGSLGAEILQVREEFKEVLQQIESPSANSPGIEKNVLELFHRTLVAFEKMTLNFGKSAEASVTL